MARPDLYPSQGPVSSYPSASYESSAADFKPQLHAAPANRHRPATMTDPLHDQPPTLTEGTISPIYPELYDFSSMNHSATAATGQPHPGFSPAFETDGDYQPGWEYRPVDVKIAFPRPSPETFQGEVHGTQPQAPWYHANQTNPAMVPDTMPRAEPMSQYVPVGESMGGCVDSLMWPPPTPMGQISPSPSQSSYHTSSPASGGAPLYSRHNSCSSVPAPMTAAIEQARFDARLQYVSDQAVSSPGEGWPSPAGVVATSNALVQPRPSSSTSASRNATPRKQKQNQTMMITTATTDYDAGTVSPAMTPSPGDSTTVAISGQPVPQTGSRPPSNQQTPGTSGREKLPAPARRTSQQKQATRQGQEQQKQPPPQRQSKPRRLQPGAQVQDQTQAQAREQSGIRTRNREAANKCRAKTKKAAADLESAERAMSTEHRELSATARGLRDEVLWLKNELLAHGNCDDHLIQQYLTGQAVLVGSGKIQSQHQHQHHHRPR